MLIILHIWEETILRQNTRSKNCTKKIILLTLIFSFCFQAQLTYATSINHPPVVVASERIQKQTMTLDQADMVIDVSKLFYDADNDSLIFKAIPDSVEVVTAEINSNLLTLEALSPGKTRIKVSADDGKLGRASSSFEVEVLPKLNNLPTVVQIINDHIGHVGGAPILIDTSNVFTDVDNDNLTLDVDSSNETVATAQLNSQMITIVPLAVGQSIITVQADDGNGGIVSTTFKLTVTIPPNQPPVVEQTINNKTGTVGNVLTIDVSNIFSDPNNDVLTIEVNSSNETVATAQISGQIITILPLAVGLNTITVQADDGKGGKVSTSFTVTIDNPTVNNSPVVAQTVRNQRATIGGIPWSIDVGNVFSDADNDSLTLAVSSSNSGVATASLNGTTLNMTQKAIGTSIITITADDGKGGLESTSFIFTVDAPSIFISDFVQSGNYNDVLEIYNPTTSPLYGYQLEIQQYNLISMQHSVQELDISLVNPNMNFVVIHPYFYDFMDITLSYYYNEEFIFRDASKITVSITLKDSNGNIVDILGTKDSTTAILESNGGYIRDKRLQSGSTNFNILEWTLLPKDDFSTIGHY
ncbi:RTX toxin [Lysinibacillus capsici]|uniref:RTX toxin n=1 Tax=Lysinibacillus capsici TaxID=2115968 RepID=UPI001C111451|nr:RTX toxin [Lysinibacillus capsici]MBU5251841.1 RTX toxin [Lysinibacillus capsici]